MCIRDRRICVGDDELYALELFLDHVVDSVAAGAAHTEHGLSLIHISEPTRPY